MFLPAGAAWLGDFEDEMAAFPNGAHDDTVDSVTQALNYLRGSSDVFGVLELMKKGWDGFVSSFRGSEESPGPNLHKEETFKIEAQLRGITRHDGAEAWLKAEACPCPRCGSGLTAAIAAQRHCNACGLDWFPNGAPEFQRVTRADVLSGRVQARRFRYGGKL